MKTENEVVISKERIAVLDSMAMFLNMNGHDAVYEATYGTGHAEHYNAEKIGKMERGGFAALWSMLDEYHRNKLATAALGEYYEECLRSYSEEE